jgi:hypothetical protein
MTVTRSSFTISRTLGRGWEIWIYDATPEAVKIAEKHLARINRRGMFGSIPNHRYTVCVETKWFGLCRRYTLV